MEPNECHERKDNYEKENPYFCPAFGCSDALIGICLSSANARPGDLIFFVGTYDTPGVSHVGIYVGGGKMLHCGDPIQYADINTSYWQSHFYAFGRPPYN